MTALTRWGLCALLALAATFGALTYRSHLIDAGHAAGSQYERDLATEARRLASLADAKTSEDSRVRHAATLRTLKDSHDRTVRDLSVALADSDHRNQRLSGRIAGLLDTAAGVHPGPPGDPGAPGPTPDPAEADSTVEALIQTTAENYEICRTNAATLGELQEWYRSLRGAPNP